MKSRYRLIEGDLSRQKELDADPKAVQQICWTINKQIDAEYNATDAAGNDPSMFS